MAFEKRNRQEILQKLKIESLNEMQIAATSAIHSKNEVLLLSPTGTGKTLAFLLPIIEQLDPKIQEVQALIITPTRELAIQIEQVAREMGTGFKINAVYGGRNFSKDKMELQHRPAILVGTPGRLLDHIERETIDTKFIQTLVLDEFDKSLEIGFDNEMIGILESITPKKKILTSATQGVEIPDFAEFETPETVDFLKDAVASKLQIQTITSPEKDKLQTLIESVKSLGNEAGIIFCNFKDSIQRVSNALESEGISHACFYGGMEQIDRERSLIKFRNGTHQLLLATDLAARGIDVPEIKYIIHYHLPLKGEEFTHRNGRTARMYNEGTAYVLKWAKEDLPDFIEEIEESTLIETDEIPQSKWKTVFVSGGRKDKISKGDIVGHFFKQGQLSKEELGIIELKNDCAFVAVHKNKAKHIVKTLNNTRIKKRKVRLQIV